MFCLDAVTAGDFEDGIARFDGIEGEALAAGWGFADLLVAIATADPEFLAGIQACGINLGIQGQQGGNTGIVFLRQGIETVTTANAIAKILYFCLFLFCLKGVTGIPALGMSRVWPTVSLRASRRLLVAMMAGTVLS